MQKISEYKKKKKNGELGRKPEDFYSIAPIFSIDLIPNNADVLSLLKGVAAKNKYKKILQAASGVADIVIKAYKAHGLDVGVSKRCLALNSTEFERQNRRAKETRESVHGGLAKILRRRENWWH